MVDVESRQVRSFNADLQGCVMVTSHLSKSYAFNSGRERKECGEGIAPSKIRRYKLAGYVQKGNALDNNISCKAMRLEAWS